MAAAPNVIPIGLLYMRPLQWWFKTRGFFLWGNPLRMTKVTWQCLRALDMWRQPWFLSQGLVLGSPCRRVTLAMDASLTDWGGGHGWPPCPRFVEWSPSHVAHQLAGDVGRVSSTETLPPRPKISPCVGAHRQHSGGLLHQPPRRSAFTPPVQAGVPNPWVFPGQLLSLKAVHIPGHLNIGSLCSREFWRECAGMRSVYFW